MSTNVKATMLLVATAAGAVGFAVMPSASAAPDCPILWGDYCANGNQQQPPAPPSISWDQGLGTLTAHVTDHSGVASQCTYNSELVNRSFSLPANGTSDVVIAPAVPAFRNWNVTVSCDNGAVANTTKFF
ncbi:hypothetical protein [Mycobacterium sp. 1274761.0]|uniref:hypothetical protein n=1 Tax=Mycobacterium sp. 1274761.0 TaxID=1834077 RepID=UPI0007FE5C6D|nr:hypothetical protein [Mycobacterium sp. 1274761.0]OBK71630.1 hypothetical protein A5651_00790 [Mycobacterium sp. 1274761.0]